MLIEVRQLVSSHFRAKEKRESLANELGPKWHLIRSGLWNHENWKTDPPITEDVQAGEAAALFCCQS